MFFETLYSMGLLFYTKNTIMSSRTNQSDLESDRLTLLLQTNVAAAPPQDDNNYHTTIDRIDRTERRKSVPAPERLSSSTSSNYLGSELVRLPPNFVPGPLDVLCARGKAALQHPGNCRFRSIIKECLPKYEAAQSKLDKSLIVSTIVDSVRRATPNGGFVKEIDGVWYEVGDHNAREKCGQG